MLFKKTLVSLLMAVAVSANADVKITQEDILGAWQVDAEAISLDGRGLKPLKSLWTFRNDGSMEGYSTDSNAHARVSEFRATLQYEIENGKIHKQVSSGRSKLETCTVVEKKEPKMTLECNGIFFFLTRK